MAIRSGLAAQVGLAAETTYGTGVTPTRFIEFNSESLALSIERIESAGLRASNRVLRSDRFVAGKKSVEGEIEAEIQSKGYGLLFKAALGASTISTPSGATNARLHRHILADPYGQAYTIQVGRPDTSGTVQPFTYSGCKVSEFTLANSIDEFLVGTWNWDGQAETTGTALATASYATSTELLSWVGGAVTIAGSAVAVVTDVEISVSTGLKTDRYTIGSSALKKEQIISEMTEISGTITAEFDGLTNYNRFVNGTLAEIECTWTGNTAIESTTYPYVKVTMPNCRFDGTTPAVEGPDVLSIELPFKALYDGTSEAITLDYMTSDTTS